MEREFTLMVNINASFVYRGTKEFLREWKGLAPKVLSKDKILNRMSSTHTLSKEETNKSTSGAQTSSLEVNYKHFNINKAQKDI